MKILYLVATIFIFTLMLSVPVNAGWWSNLFKISSEEKAVIKTEVKTVQEEKPLTNYERGMQWESTAQKELCAAVGGCLKTAEAAAQKLRWSNYKEELFIISGGKATNKFINDNGLYKTWTGKRFVREPDFLEIKQVNGKITQITIIDAKTSQKAVREAQDIDFNDLCSRSYIPCDVKYVVPKNSLSKSDANFLCLATPTLGFIGPVGWSIEALCFLATS